MLYRNAFLTCLLIFVATAAAGDDVFDAHLHVSFDNSGLLAEEVNAYLGANTGKALVISPSYLVDAAEDLGLGPAYQNRANRVAFNDRTAELVRSHPDQFRGLCGLSWNWKDISDVLKKCLSHKEMIGIKLRFEDYGSRRQNRLANPVVFGRIDNALSNNPQTRIALIHTPVADSDLSDPAFEEDGLSREVARSLDEQEIGSILKLAELHPGTNFIVAHSFNSPHLVKVLKDKISGRAEPPKNIWLDISESLNDGTEQNKLELYEAWTYFGINRVIMGTDMPLGEGRESGLAVPAEFHRLLEQDNSIIKSPADRERVYRTNVKELLSF